MDEIDKKIISILNYGSKKQIEIVTLLENEASGKTVRRHLSDLCDNGEIARESDGGQFYLPSHQKEFVRPQPWADQDKVHQILHNVEQEFGTLYSDLEEFYDDEGLFERVLSWISTTGMHVDEDDLIDGGKNTAEHLAELNNISERNHYVLDNDENLDAFIRIFDSILDVLEEHESDAGELAVPDLLFELFFMSSSSIYNNWHDGKENEKFDAKMTERADRVLSIADESGSKFHSYLQNLLINVSRDDSKDVYLSMVKSGEYEVESLLEDAFLTYDVYNEINKLISDLDEAIGQVDDEDIIIDIENLRGEILRLYTREIQDKG